MHLATRPSSRMRGAASLLIRWGIERATKAKESAYLEAGSADKKFGFNEVGDARKLDLGSYGMKAHFELYNMAYDPPEPAAS